MRVSENILIFTSLRKTPFYYIPHCGIYVSIDVTYYNCEQGPGFESPRASTFWALHIKNCSRSHQEPRSHAGPFALILGKTAACGVLTAKSTFLDLPIPECFLVNSARCPLAHWGKKYLPLSAIIIFALTQKKARKPYGSGPSQVSFSEALRYGTSSLGFLLNPKMSLGISLPKTRKIPNCLLSRASLR
jgi:hypothetical protein